MIVTERVDGVAGFLDDLKEITGGALKTGASAAKTSAGTGLVAAVKTAFGLKDDEKPPPPQAAKIPWGTIAIVGGVLVVGAVAVTMATRKRSRA